MVAVVALKWRASVRGELGHHASRPPKKPAVLHVAQWRQRIHSAKVLLSREATARRRQERGLWLPPLREDRHRTQLSTWAAKVRGVTFYHRIWPLFGGVIKWSILLNLCITNFIALLLTLFPVDPKNSYGWKTPPITPNLFPSSPNPKRSTSLSSLPDADVTYLNSQWPKVPYQDNKSQQVCCVYISALVAYNVVVTVSFTLTLCLHLVGTRECQWE